MMALLDVFSLFITVAAITYAIVLHHRGVTMAQFEANLKSHISAEIAVLKADFKKITGSPSPTPVPAPAPPPPPAAPSIDDAVAAIDAQVAALQAKKQAIVAAHQTLTGLIAG